MDGLVKPEIKRFKSMVRFSWWNRTLTLIWLTTHMQGMKGTIIGELHYYISKLETLSLKNLLSILGIRIAERRNPNYKGPYKVVGMDEKL